MKAQSQLKRRAAMCTAIMATAVYLGYRGLFTLNLSSPLAVLVSLVLYSAECYGGFLLFLYFFQIWEVRNPSPVPVQPGRTVDVLIPTYNEDAQLLRGTISAALRIEYPHKTYVLDDGKRESVRALCEELGAVYITRPTNLHAKAGNLNHALQMTDGEFVVIFDADHVAEQHFIDRLIGYFVDEKLAFVQTPHAFYNFDAFQGVLNYERGVYWEEGMLFYNVTQPGKNRWNGVSFCGSAAIFRRSALVDVGLVATESITEDLLTGLRMHAKGWKSLFVNERLVAAMAAEDITSFNTQRLRWGEGNLGIFAIANPLTMKGLTWQQRVCYLGTMLSWTTGVQKLFIYCTPMLMLLTDVPPVNAMTWTLAWVVSAYLVTVWAGVKIASNGYGWLLAIELSQMTCFWTQVRATWRAIFKRRKARFVVTSKRGRQSNGVLRHVAPHITYIAGSAIAITWALTRYRLRLSHDPVGLTIGSALLIVNSYFAWVVIRRGLRSKNRRSAWRHPIALHVDYRTLEGHGQLVSGQCVTRDISEGGLALVAFQQLPSRAELALTISAAGQSVTCRGIVRSQIATIHYHSRRGPAAEAFVYGVEFLEPSKDQLEVIWWMGAQFAVGLHYERFSGGQFGLGSISSRKLPAHEEEGMFELPVTFRIGEGRNAVAVTEGLGPETMTVLLSEHLQPEQPVHLTLETPFGPIDARAAAVDFKSRTLAGREVRETRFRFGRLSPAASATLQATLGQRDSKVLGPALRSRPQRRPPESLRPAALVLGTTAIAASFVIGWVLLFEQDDVALARAEAGRYLTRGQIARLVEMADHVRVGDAEEEARALRLRAVMVALDRPSKVAQIDETLAHSDPITLEGQALKAESLQNLGRLQQADAIFRSLLSKLDQFYDDRSRWDLVLAAARNASNLGNLPDAVQRYKQLTEYGVLSDEARREFAGLLYRSGDPAEAEALLRQGSPSSEDLRLLASLYSADKSFDKATGIYERLLQIQPNDPLALRGLADNLSWSHEFSKASKVYEELLSRAPQNVELKERLAETLLFAKQYRESARQYAALLEDEPRNRNFRDGFLTAAAGSVSLTAADKRLLEKIYRHRDDDHSVRFLTNLLNAVAKHGEPEQAVVLLQTLLKAQPNDKQLRLRLADTLHNLGRFQDADVQYGLLLGRAVPDTTVKTRRVFSGEQQ